jgi:hypothetical protein
VEFVDDLARCHDMTARRAAVLEAFDAGSGERLLEVGCGSGVYLREIAVAVGATDAGWVSTSARTRFRRRERGAPGWPRPRRSTMEGHCRAPGPDPVRRYAGRHRLLYRQRRTYGSVEAAASRSTAAGRLGIRRATGDSPLSPTRVAAGRGHQAGRRRGGTRRACAPLRRARPHPGSPRESVRARQVHPRRVP